MLLPLPPCHFRPLSFIGGSGCPSLSSFSSFYNLPLGLTLLNMSHLMGLTEMMMNWIPWKSLMILCFRVMVVVLVKLAVKEDQVPLHVSWCPPLSCLHYLDFSPRILQLLRSKSALILGYEKVILKRFVFPPMLDVFYFLSSPHSCAALNVFSISL